MLNAFHIDVKLLNDRFVDFLIQKRGGNVNLINFEKWPLRVCLTLKYKGHFIYQTKSFIYEKIFHYLSVFGVFLLSLGSNT